MPTAESWRSLLQQVIDEQAAPQTGAPPVPEPVLEGQIDLESGGNPNTVSGDNAIGLGQIVPGGYEWGVWQATHPDIAPADLYDPHTNLSVMVAGMKAREAQGGAYQDWYMAAAGYLGGATKEGFNGAADSLGTTGQDYVRHIRLYVNDKFGADVAEAIDASEPGAAVAAGGDWEHGAITYDPKAPGDPSQAFGSNVLGGITNPLDGIGSIVSDAKDAVNRFLPRAGVFAAGLVLLAVGAVVVVGPERIAKTAVPELRLASLASSAGRRRAKGGNGA